MTNTNMTNLYRIYLKRWQSLSFGSKPWRLLVATLVLSLVATGCANRKSAAATPTSSTNAPPAQVGNWFCQPAAPGAKDSWECIQDKGLAANPKPDRLPDADTTLPRKQRARSPQNTNQSGPEPQPDGSAVQLPTPQPPPPPPPGLSQLRSSDPPGAGRSAQPAPTNPVTRKQVTPTQQQAPSATSRNARPAPDYIRLALQPAQPVAIMDLPGNYYAVQLAALSSARDIETFVAKHRLNDLTAAKVAVNGKIRYVLILGIYNNREKAELAAAGQKPAPLAGFTPWVRKLSNLQKAMLAAEAKGKS